MEFLNYAFWCEAFWCIRVYFFVMPMLQERVDLHANVKEVVGVLNLNETPQHGNRLCIIYIYGD